MNKLTFKSLAFKFLSLSLLFCILSPIITFNTVNAFNSTQKQVKIGFVKSDNLISIGANGTLSGYLYEYFTMISNYVNWNCEYISGTHEEIMQLAKDGEIDAISGMHMEQEDSELFDFPIISTGKSYITLSTSPNNHVLDPYDYNTFNGMIVGVDKSYPAQNKSLDNFCNIYSIEVVKRYYYNTDELNTALSEGKVDAFLSTDIPLTNPTKTISRFSPTEHYIATLKNNNLIDDLNYALTKINQNNDFFPDELYKKYFQVPDYSNPTFSEDEISFAKKSIKIRVSVPPDMYPMAYVDDKTDNFNGTSRELLNSVTKLTGLQFEYVNAKSIEDAMNMVSSGETDMTACVLQNFLLAQQYDLKLTMPYSEIQNMLISTRPINASEFKTYTMAQLKGSTTASHYEVGKIIKYDSMIDCIDAVRKNEVDFTFCNLNSVSILLKNMNSKDIIATSKINDMCRFSFGFNKSTDNRLLSIVEKVIISTEYSGNGYQSVLDDSDIKVKSKSLTDLVYTHPNESIFIVLIAAVLAIIMFFFMMHSKIKQNRTLTEYGKTYRTLADSAGEISFIYYFDKDNVNLFGRNCMQISSENELENFKTMLLQNESPFTTLTLKQFNNAISCAEIGKNYSAELEIALISGVKKWFRVIYTVISTSNTKNKPSRMIGRLYDIDKERKEHDLLLSISELDPLTKLNNRSSAEKRISHILASSNYNEPGIICLIDIDHFKDCNDLYGHQVGDDILKYLANILKITFDQSDVICRWGGDEFWIFSTASKSIEAITKKVECVQNLMLKFEHNSKPLPITLSIGGVIAHKGITLDILFKMADDTLYEVKRAGRNAFIVH